MPIRQLSANGRVAVLALAQSPGLVCGVTLRQLYRLALVRPTGTRHRTVMLTALGQAVARDLVAIETDTLAAAALAEA